MGKRKPLPDTWNVAVAMFVYNLVVAYKEYAQPYMCKTERIR